MNSVAGETMRSRRHGTGQSRPTDQPLLKCNLNMCDYRRGVLLGNNTRPGCLSGSRHHGKPAVYTVTSRLQRRVLNESGGLLLLDS